MPRSSNAAWSVLKYAMLAGSIWSLRRMCTSSEKANQKMLPLRKMLKL